MNIVSSLKSAVWDVTTSIVADTIALWNPQKAAEYRQIRGAYKRYYVAANLKGPYSGHRPGNVSGDAAILAKREPTTARVRDMERNNPLVSGMIQKRTTMIVGDEVGFKPQVADRNGNDLPAVNKILENRFYRWSEEAFIDGSSLTDGCELVENHRTLDGEVIVREVSDEGSRNPFKVQILETDYLNPMYGVYGIEFTPGGKPAFFHIYDRHPQDIYTLPAASYSAGKTTRVSADDCLILIERTRSSQHRGISPLAAAAYKLYGVDDLEDAELVASRSACAYGLIITSPLPEFAAGNDDESENKDDRDRNREYMEAGGIYRAQPGETVDAFKNERPNSNFESFTRGRKRDAAGSLTMSYETATGDYSQVNYSSARMGRNIEWANIRRRQRSVRKLLNWIYRKWLRYEIIFVGVPGISASEYKRDTARFEAVSWQLAGNDGIDPVKEVNAFESELALGVNSRTRFAAERGRDFGEIIKEIAAEKAQLEELGIYQEDPTVSETAAETESTTAIEAPGEQQTDNGTDSQTNTQEMADE